MKFIKVTGFISGCPVWVNAEMICAVGSAVLSKLCDPREINGTQITMPGKTYAVVSETPETILTRISEG